MSRLFADKGCETCRSSGRSGNRLRRSTIASENREALFIPHNGMFPEPEVVDWMSRMPASTKQLCIKRIQMTEGNRFVQDLSDPESHISANSRSDRVTSIGSGHQTHILKNEMQNDVNRARSNPNAVQRKTKNLPDMSISELIKGYYPMLSKPKPDIKEDKGGLFEFYELSGEVQKYESIEKQVAIYNGYDINDTKIESLKLHYQTLSDIDQKIGFINRYKEYPRIGDSAGILRYAVLKEMEKVQQQMMPPKPKPASIAKKKESAVEFEMLIEELSDSKLSLIRHRIKSKEKINDLL
jgi:hypothetical protein